MHPNEKQNISQQDASFVIVMGRLFWLFMGPLLLMLLLFSFATSRKEWVSVMTGIYFVVLALMVLGRWNEHRGGSPMTVYGDPATPKHFRQYLLFTIPLAIGAWVVAMLLGQR